MNNIPALNPGTDLYMNVPRMDIEMFGEGGLIPDNDGRNRINPSKAVHLAAGFVFSFWLFFGSGMATDVQAKGPYNPASYKNEDKVKIDGYYEWLVNGGDGTPFRYVEWARQVGKTDEEIRLGLEVAMQRFQESDDWLLYGEAILTMSPDDKESFDRVHSSRQSGVDQDLGIETKVVVLKYYDEASDEYVYKELVLARRFVAQSVDSK